MDDKRFFSRVGFSYFMMVVLTAVVQFVLSLVLAFAAPQAAGLPITSWLLSMVPLYLVGIPVCAKLMQRLPKMQFYQNEMRPGSGSGRMHLHFCDVCGKHHWKYRVGSAGAGNGTGSVF